MSDLHVLGKIGGFFSQVAMSEAVIFTVLITVILYAVIRTVQAERHVKAMAKDRTQIEAILASHAEAWAIMKNNTLVKCADPFFRLFGFQPGVVPEVIDLVTLLETMDSQRFKYHLDLLINESVPFELSLALENQAQKVHLRGQAFNSMDATATGQYILWVRPISQEEVQLYSLTVHNETLTRRLSLVEQALNTLPYPIWLRDVHNHLSYCNAFYAKMLDTTPQNALVEQMNILPPLIPHDATTPTRQSQQNHFVIKGERRLMEFQELNHDVFGNQMDGVVGYGHDYTAIEQAKSELEKHREGQREVLEMLSSPIAVFGRDIRLQFFNSAYANLFHFNLSWLNARPSYGEVLEELRVRRNLPEVADFPAYKQKQLQLFTSVFAPTQEVLYLPDGRTLRTVISPHPQGGLLFMYEDVTDKLSLERQFNTLIDVQRETLDHLFEGIIVFGSDNRLRLSNPAFAQLWNLEESKVHPGLHITEVIDGIAFNFEREEAWEGFKNNILKITTERMPYDGRLEIKDNAVINYSYVPLPDGGHMISHLDMTDESQIERALRERNEALETADKLKSQFITNVSYELREPLNNIIGFTEILNNQYFGGLNERQMEYNQAVLNSSQQLLALINDILDLASIEAGYFYLRVEQFSAEDMTNAILDSISALARAKNVKLEKVIAPDITLIEGDETRIKQVLYNLLSNAIKYTPEEGEVQLIIEKTDTHVIMRVEDNGIGIAPENLKRVFDKFERVDNAASKEQGVGLGLALVRNLIELHGGNVEIYSEVGKGTQVICQVPITVPQAQKAMAA